MSSLPSVLEDALKVSLASYIDANSSNVPSRNIFGITKELSIGRYTLDISAKEIYEQIEDLNKVKQLVREEIKSGIKKEELLLLLNSIDEIRNRLTDAANKLASQAVTVSRLSKTAAEIESLQSSRLDAAQLYSVITQLPNLLLTLLKQQLLQYLNNYLQQLINSHPALHPSNSANSNNSTETSSDTITLSPSDFSISVDIDSLAAEIANKFDALLQEQVHVLTYNPQQQAAVPQGIIEDQVIQMLKTIPIQETDTDLESDTDTELVIDPNSDKAEQLRSI